MPSSEDLESYGLDEDEILAIQSTFRFVPKEVGSQKTPNTADLEKLLTEFDCSTVELGQLVFRSEIEEISLGRHFGFCEADLLIQNENGEIVMLDHAHPDSLSVICATNEASFFEAIAKFVEVRANKSEWSGRIEEAVSECVNLSKSDTSSVFYRTLLAFLQ